MAASTHGGTAYKQDMPLLPILVFSMSSTGLMLGRIYRTSTLAIMASLWRGSSTLVFHRIVTSLILGRIYRECVTALTADQ
jgi:hypothetical protein